MQTSSSINYNSQGGDITSSTSIRRSEDEKLDDTKRRPMPGEPIEPRNTSTRHPRPRSRQTISSTTSMPLHYDPGSDKLVVGTSKHRRVALFRSNHEASSRSEVRFPRPRPDQQVLFPSCLVKGGCFAAPLYVAVEKQCCFGFSTRDSVSLSTTKIVAPISGVAWPPPRHPTIQPPCMPHGSHEAVAPDMVPGVDRRLYAESAP